MAVRINGVEITDAWVVPFSPKRIRLIPWRNQLTLEPPPCEEAFRKAGLNVVESITGRKFVVRCGGLRGLNEQPPAITVQLLRNPVKVGELIYINIGIEGNALLTATDNAGNTFYISESKLLSFKAEAIYDRYVFVYRKCYGQEDAGTDRIEIEIGLPQGSTPQVENLLQIRINGCSYIQAQFLYSLLGQDISVEDDNGNTYMGKLISADLRFVANDLNPYKAPADIYEGTLEVLL